MRPLIFNDLCLLTVKQINEHMPCLCVHKSMRLGNNLFSMHVPINYNTRLGGGNNVNVPNILSAHSRQSLRWVGSSTEIFRAVSFCNLYYVCTVSCWFLNSI